MASNTRSSTYREYRPPTGLADIVDCFWRRERWGPPEDGLGILPDGRIDLIWAAHGEMLVAGPQTRPLESPLPPQFVVVGVRLRPGIGPPLLGVPAHELVDLHVSLEAIDTRVAASLQRDLASVENPAEAPDGLARATARIAASQQAPDPLVQRAATLLADPVARVKRIADELSLSERQLHRRFRETVGYGPKTLQRVLRFQRLVETFARGRSQADGLARIAASIGYSDQAHLTRESAHLSGLSPVRLEQALAGNKNEFERGSRGG
jgi:AraC-like DNA-binding protein